MDPALASSPPGWALLDTTCARLMAYPDKPPPAGFRLAARGRGRLPVGLARRQDVHVPAAQRLPVQRRQPGARDRVRPGDQPHARARDEIAGLQYVRDIVGAGQVVAGKSSAAVRRRRAREHARRAPHPSRAGLPQPDGVDFFCAVPPTLPIDAEGVRRISRGRAVLRRRLPAEASGSCCGGTRSTAASGHTTSTASTSISAPRRRRRCCGVSIEGRRTGATRSPGSLRSRPRARREVRDQPLAALQLRPGLTLRLLAFNSVAAPVPRQSAAAQGGQLRARPPGDRPRRRPAREPARAISTCPRACPGSGTRTSTRSSARTWRARRRSHRGTCAAARPSSTSTELAPDGDRPAREAAARGDRAGGGGRGIPIHSATAAYFNKLGERGRAVGHRVRPVDAELHRPVRVHQPALRPGSSGATNFARFATRPTSTSMRRAVAPQGTARQKAYRDLDLRLARDAAPLARSTS